jgi:hypothetical protein
MAVPKGFKTNININPSKIGPERRQEILDGIADKGTFLPRGVSEEDMDETFVDFVCAFAIVKKFYYKYCKNK